MRASQTTQGMAASTLPAPMLLPHTFTQQPPPPKARQGEVRSIVATRRGTEHNGRASARVHHRRGGAGRGRGGRPGRPARWADAHRSDGGGGGRGGHSRGRSRRCAAAGHNVWQRRALPDDRSGCEAVRGADGRARGRSRSPDGARTGVHGQVHQAQPGDGRLGAAAGPALPGQGPTAPGRFSRDR